MSTDQRRDRDAKDSTIEAKQDRAGSRTASQSDQAESHAAAASKDKESNSAARSDTRRVARTNKKSIEVKTSTKAAAIVKPKVAEPRRKFSQCPRCHENRYKPEQFGTTVKCTNCRVEVVLR